MKKGWIILALAAVLCLLAGQGAAEDAGMPESGTVHLLGEHGITLVMPDEYVSIRGSERYGLYFRNADLAVGVTPTDYTSMEEFKAVLRELGMDILAERNETVRQIAVSVLTPDRDTGRYAIAALQAAPGKKLVILDFLPDPESQWDGEALDARVNRVLGLVRRPEDTLASDMAGLSENLQGTALQEDPGAPKTVSFADLGCSVTLPGSMLKDTRNLNNELAAFANEFVSVYFFVYEGWTVAAYESYTGFCEADFAVTEKQVNGIGMRFYEYVGNDEAEAVAGAALYNVGKGVRLEMVFIPADKTLTDENWFYISLISSSVALNAPDDGGRSGRETGPAERSEIASQAAALAERLFDFYEAMLSAETRAASSVIRYAENGDYASLLAVRRDAQNVQGLSLPGGIPDIFYTEDLTDLGIDPDSIDSLLLSPCSLNLSLLNNTLAFQRNFAYSGYFSHQLTELASQRARNFIAYCQTLAQMQPYLLLKAFPGIMEEPVLAELWRSIPERWPGVGAGLPAETGEEDAGQRLYELIGKLYGLEETEALLSDLYVSAMRVIDQEYAAKQIEESRRADYYVPEHMPVSVPVPDSWLDPDRASLRAEDPEGRILTILTSSVAETDFTAYVSALLSSAAPENKLEGSASEGWACRMEELGLCFSMRPDGAVAIQYDPTLATVEKISASLFIMNAAD